MTTAMQLLSSAASKGAEAASSAGLAARHAAQKAREHTEAAVVARKEQYLEVKQYLGALKERVDVNVLRDAGFGRKGRFLRGAKVEALERFVSLSKPIRARVMLALRESTKDAALSDPDMWICVRERTGRLIDLFWDDLTLYLESMVFDAKEQLLNRAADHKVLAEMGSESMCCTPSWFRAKLLYNYLPFDFSIFGQIKSPLFLLLTLLSITPMFGIRVAFFTIILICIVAGRPPDEYQLVTFILMFKGAQFLSSGVLMACVAAVKYYMCVKADGHHTCDTEGPGVSQDLVTSSVDFFGSCFLVWIAFLLLPCSRSFGGTRDLVEDPESAAVGSGCCEDYDKKRGGRLTGLLGYDLCCFLLSCALIYGLTMVDLASTNHADLQRAATDKDLLLSDLQRWQFRSRVFFGRILYGLLSFPFMVFQLPVLSGILTHTIPTGYNSQGLCVPYLLRPMPDAEGDDGAE